MVRPRHLFFSLRSGAASARHPSRIPPPPPEPDSRSLTSFGNLQTFQHSNLPTFLRSIPFIIIFFAHPHHLTLTESYSYKKQGRGRGPRYPYSTQTLLLFSTASKPSTHNNARNPNSFMHLLHSSLDTLGVGHPSFYERLSALSVASLSFCVSCFSALAGQ